jgi:predicted TPR repeat methyltransferase
MANALWPAEADPVADARALLEQGRPQDALAVLAPLIESGTGGLLTRLEYARALTAGGRPGDALSVARETALLYPTAAAAAQGLGETILAAGQVATAIAEFQRALRVDANLESARAMLGRAWLEAGEPEKALEAVESLPEDAPGMQTFLAEARAMRSLPRSNGRYVRHLFDQFSLDYDRRMIGELGYAAPRILRELAGMLLAQAADLAILDLGCGTGLAGQAFQDMARQLDGIDLSPAMIEKARARGIYNALHVGDLENSIPASGEYDVAVAADTLVYLGELSAVFAAVRTALRPGGAFLFTVEKLDGEGYALGPKRRWLHSQAYLCKEAEKTDFTVAGMMECSPRTEAGVPVPGLAVALTKPEGHSL